MFDPARVVADNPFYVLGLPVGCERADVEREGQKLLGMLALGLGQAATYATPLGPQARTPDKVRQAMADLRDPRRRLLHELWARVPADAAVTETPDHRTLPPASGWTGARRALGWGP